jgi:hypothetical protein
MTLEDVLWKHNQAEREFILSLIAQTNAQALVSRPPCPEVAPVCAEVAGREIEAVASKGISR